MAYVTVINEHQHVQQIVSGHHHLTADETASGAGSAGLAPRELLLASLGADTAVALRRHAMQQDWTLGKITVGLRWSRDAAGRDHIERRLAFARPLTPEQKARLLEIADATPVTAVLRPGIAIESALMD